MRPWNSFKSHPLHINESTVDVIQRKSKKGLKITRRRASLGVSIRMIVALLDYDKFGGESHSTLVNILSRLFSHRSGLP